MVSFENALPAAPPTRTRRLFFALWPSSALAEEIDCLSAKLDAGPHARRIDPAALHITLAFLGAVIDSRVAELTELAASLPSPKLHFQLDRIGCFRRSGIVWAGSHEPDPALSQFVAALNAGLKGLGYAIEAREFVPHVTVFRRGLVRGTHPIDPPLVWHSEGFRLVESIPGAGYKPLWRNDAG